MSTTTTSPAAQQKSTMQHQGLYRMVCVLEDHIIALSGPALATSGVIAGLDILTNNIIRSTFPMVGNILGVIWAICLMLTLDFQVLTLGVRTRRLSGGTLGKGQKVLEILLSLLIAAALAYVSVQMSSIFAKMLTDSRLTLDAAQASLGISPNMLIYERSAMVMLLIFLSGWLRDVDGNVSVSFATLPVPPANDERIEQITTLVETLASIVSAQHRTIQEVQQNMLLLQSSERLVLVEKTETTLENKETSVRVNVPTLLLPDVPGVAPEVVNRVIAAYKSGTPWRSISGNYSKIIKPVRAAYLARQNDVDGEEDSHEQALTTLANGKTSTF